MSQLTETIQNDILKEFMVRNTTSIPTTVYENHCRYFEFTAKNIQNSTLSLFPVTMQEAGATRY